MGFESARRRGYVWEDAKHLDQVIRDFPFCTTGTCEKDFERGLATSLMANKSQFKGRVITQIDKAVSVRSVYCFGKKHRPDMTIDESGIAIEVKFVTYSGLIEAIGQAHLYRLRYKFVFLILIVSEDRKSVYVGLNNNQENDLEDLLCYLADELNIFAYIVPAFSIKPGEKKCVAFFESLK